MRKRVSRSGEIGFVLDYARYLVDAQLSCINFELENVAASGNSYSRARSFPKRIRGKKGEEEKKKKEKHLHKFFFSLAHDRRGVKFNNPKCHYRPRDLRMHLVKTSRGGGTSSARLASWHDWIQIYEQATSQDFRAAQGICLYPSVPVIANHICIEGKFASPLRQ